ncbi:MAG: hypothetical protein ACTHLP_02670 [Rhizobiaceae bacterium]|jgi:hypothetical protein
MSTTKGHQPMLGNAFRAAFGLSVAALMLGGMALGLSACGGGYPMTVEQRYSEPKTPDEVLQDKVDAAKRIERAHGAM